MGSLGDCDEIFCLFAFVDRSLEALPLFLCKGCGPSVVRFVGVLNPTLLLCLPGMEGVIANKMPLVK